MPKSFLKRILPHPTKVKEHPLIAPLGSAVHDSDIWHLTKHSVAGAFFIGVFCALQPIPLQTVLAALLAILFKRNLALSVALVFITNPLTMGPIYYFNYWVGDFFFDPSQPMGELSMHGLWEWLKANFDQAGKALVLGSLINGLVFGLLSYWLLHWLWIYEVRRKWQQRLSRRQQRSID